MFLPLIRCQIFFLFLLYVIFSKKMSLFTFPSPDEFLTEASYSLEYTTSRDIMRMIAFATCVVRVMGNAFSTYQRVRYRAFVKRIGRTIRSVRKKTPQPTSFKTIWFCRVDKRNTSICHRCQFKSWLPFRKVFVYKAIERICGSFLI